MNKRTETQLTWSLYIMAILFLAVMMLGCAKQTSAIAPAPVPPCLDDASYLNNRLATDQAQLVTLGNQAATDQATIDTNNAWIAAHPGSPGITGHQHNINDANADLQLVSAATASTQADVTATQQRLLIPACVR